MPSQSPDATAVIARQLNADPKREAVDSQRGYDWQRWLTLERWLDLEGESDLCIEFGEDITFTDDAGVVTIQAKDRSGTVSLGVAKVLEIVEAAFLRDDAVRTVLWTTSTIVMEKLKPFAVPGLQHWKEVQEENEPLDPLRTFLEKSLGGRALDKVKAADDTTLLGMVRRLEFVTSEVGLDKLRRRVLGKLEPRLGRAGILNPSVIREVVGAALFEFVAGRSVRPRREDRWLSRPSLDEQISIIYQKFTAAQHPLFVQQTMEVIKGAVRDTVVTLEEQGRLGPALTGQSSTAAALERDLRARYQDRVARSMFDEVRNVDELALLGEEVLAGQVSAVSQELRRDILLRASRSSSVHGKSEDAQRFLAAALQLPGPASPIVAQARLLASGGDPDGAIRQLRDRQDADAFSTLLSILFRERGAEATLEHYGQEGTVERLTSSGFVIVAAAFMEQGDRAGALGLLQQAGDATLSDAPALRMRRGLYSFASLFDDEAQAAVQMGIPMDARAQPNVSPEGRRQALDNAIADFKQVRVAAQGLLLPRAASIAAAYETWAELLHPDRAANALVRLKRDLADGSSEGLLCVQFAFAFDTSFDPEPLRVDLGRKSRLGGLTEDEFRALVATALHVSTPVEMVTFIAEHRERLYRDFGESGTLGIEIQAIAKSGDAGRARKLLSEVVLQLDTDVVPFLEAVVDAAEGKDPVEAYTKAYEQNPSSPGLRNLLGELAKASRWEEFATRAEELFERTNDPIDLADAARAYVRLRRDEDFLRVVQVESKILDTDPNLPPQVGWAHFRLGQLREAKQAAERRSAENRDLSLESALAIESGDWELLPGILSAYLDGPDRSADDLVRAARVAQIIGQGPLVELVNRAVEKAPEDPNILVTVYSLVIEEGLEEALPESSAWLGKALSLSSKDGPVWQVDLKEVVAHSREQLESGRKITEAVMEGSLPMLAAARGLGGSQLQVILGSMVANWHARDGRDKMAVNLFSGRRSPAPLNVKVLGLDISALMTLTWLELLPTLEKVYTELHIPAGLMMELFDGQRRIREQQKSQLRNARELEALVVAARVRVLPSSRRSDALDADVGNDLADLIRQSESVGGVLVRPSPIIRPSSLDQQVDASEHGAVLSDVDALLDTLVANSCLDAEQEMTARDQSRSRDDSWPSPAKISIDSPLFLDGLTIVYLQQARILDVVVSAFPEVWIAERTAIEAKRIVGQEKVTSELLALVTTLRTFVAQGLRSGRIRSGRYQDAWNLGTPEQPSALNMIADLGTVETAVFDDRAINKDTFVADNKGRRVPMATSLDVIEDLVLNGAISKPRRRQVRARLRRSGAMLMPLDTDELVEAVARNQGATSPEFRAIQESIDLVRLVEAPVFPADIPWFAGALTAIKSAIHALWNDHTDVQRSELLSNQLMALHLAPEDWEFGWKDNPPPDWAATVSGAFWAGLSFPTSIPGGAEKEAFDDWIDRALLDPLRKNSPERHTQLVRYLIDLLHNGITRAS